MDAARRQAQLRFDIWAEPMAFGHYPEQFFDECPVYRDWKCQEMCSRETPKI